MEEARDAQPRLVMTGLRRAAFSEEGHVRAWWLPTFGFYSPPRDRRASRADGRSRYRSASEPAIKARAKWVMQ